jgi:Peptidase family M1 domain
MYVAAAPRVGPGPRGTRATRWQNRGDGPILHGPMNTERPSPVSRPVAVPSPPTTLHLAVLLFALVPAGSRAQTLPSTAVDPGAAVRAGGRPVPGPVYESPAFSRAVARGTRTRAGRPGAGAWVQHPRYDIQARLDPDAGRVSGSERVVYRNASPDTLARLAVHLRQNVFAKGSPRRSAVAVTGGVTMSDVSVDGRVYQAEPPTDPALSVTEAPPADPHAGRYSIQGTVMWIGLVRPLLPGDSALLDMAWSYAPANTPSDGREGRDGHVWFMGYWYPQIAVYDDVEGWVADPYLLEAEFYMEPADYDVRLTVPHGWVVGATGTLANASDVLAASARDSLAAARRTGRVVRVVTPGPTAANAFVGGGATATWRFTAPDVRDFSWGTSDQYVWDATRALVDDGARRDTVAIHSFYRLSAPAAAWAVGGARFTRDAIEQLSRYLWAYPWPQMTSMEGVLDGGGMEYPMMTLMQPWADTLSLAGDLMHETGHMWFPMQVGSNETRHPWMDEGFTQFDVAQAMRPLYGEPRRGGRANDSEPGQRRLYVAAARRGDDQSLMLAGDDFPQSLYFIMYYDKTAQVLAALRGVLGEETFHRAFREYGRRWIGRHPYPEDFFNAMDDATGRDLSWFWRTWFYEGWALDQAVAGVEAHGDSVAITVEDRGMAPMPVLLSVTRDDGSTQRVDVPVDVWLGGARRHVVRVAARPSVVRVEIDADAFFPDVDRTNQVWVRAGG